MSGCFWRLGFGYCKRFCTGLTIWGLGAEVRVLVKSPFGFLHGIYAGLGGFGGVQPCVAQLDQDHRGCGSPQWVARCHYSRRLLLYLKGDPYRLVGAINIQVQHGKHPPIHVVWKAVEALYGSFRKLEGTPFWGPYNKDPTISGAILGPLVSETSISIWSIFQALQAALLGVSGAPSGTGSGPKLRLALQKDGGIDALRFVMMGFEEEV